MPFLGDRERTQDIQGWQNLSAGKSSRSHNMKVIAYLNSNVDFHACSIGGSQFPMLFMSIPHHPGASDLDNGMYESNTLRIARKN